MTELQTYVPSGYAVERGGKILSLTRAEVDAARLKKRRAEARKQAVDPAVEAIAAARPRRRKSETVTTPAPNGADRFQAILDMSFNDVLVDENGDKIGVVGQVYLDDESGKPEWITVKTGWFGGSESFVPVRDVSAIGNEIRVPYSKDKVRDAPRVDEDGHIGLAQEQELYRHYGIDADRDETMSPSEEHVHTVFTSRMGTGKTAHLVKDVVLSEERAVTDMENDAAEQGLPDIDRF